jgi:GT2 family glycosyltransferase
MTKVKIITVHYGKIKTTLNCLTSLNHLITLNDLILINNSQTNIGKIIKDKFKQVTVVNNQKNLGYAAALNIGIKLALKNNPQFILILNNDIVVKKNFLKELLTFSKTDEKPIKLNKKTTAVSEISPSGTAAVKSYLKNNKADLISPRILDQHSNIWFAGGEIDRKRLTAGHTRRKLDFLSGCCLLIKRQVFDKIGFFDERYFMYYEDVDFCFRARKAGFRLGIADKAIIYHYIKHSQKSTKLMEYYLARNHLLFVKKHASFFVKIREFIRLPKTLWQHYRNKEFAALIGIKDALFNLWC